MNRTAHLLMAALLAGISLLLVTRSGGAQSSVALTGTVSSQQEGPMEGVLVTAKKDGSTVAVTVVSDGQGKYSFPQSRLSPGHYLVQIRAVGYELESPASTDVAAGKAALRDLKLRTIEDVSTQLTNAEWLASAPGTDEQKKLLLACTGCHTLERIVRSKHTPDEWAKIVPRMRNYDSGSQPGHPQLQKIAADEEPVTPPSPKFTQYLASINLSTVPKWQYSFKTFPRPKGAATKVIITEYDLPHPFAMPHDAAVAPNGMIWYADFGAQYVARLDPKTGSVKEWPAPVPKPDYPKGNRTVYFDKDGNVWMSMQQQGAAAKFDVKAEKFQIYSVPAGGPKDGSPRVSGTAIPADGKLWVQAPRGPQGRTAEWLIQRVDIKSGEWEQPINVYSDFPKDSPAAKKPHSIYDIINDSKGNVYFLDHADTYVGKVDAKTHKVSYWATPTADSGPRRGHADSQDRIWFGEDRGFAIGMFDPKTEKISEWKIGTPFSEAYDAVLDKAGFAWAGGQTTDRVARVNTKTNEMVEYLMPRSTNVRRVDVDNSTNPPTLWVGNNHAASIIKVEPQE